MRLPRLKPDEMTARQREVHDRIAGKRGRVGGPYQVWLQSPELCDRQEQMTSYCRWECSLPEKLREFGLCLAARFCDAQYSWNAHVDPAIKLGIHPDIMKAVAEKREPVFQHDDERLYYAFAMELMRDHFVSDETYKACRAQFGDRGLVDIVASIGAYMTLSLCLNAFQVDLQPDRPQPFPDICGFARVDTLR
jgi:4-carboxymuconolactone decarboxylase